MLLTFLNQSYSTTNNGLLMIVILTKIRTIEFSRSARPSARAEEF